MHSVTYTVQLALVARVKVTLPDQHAKIDDTETDAAKRQGATLAAAMLKAQACVDQRKVEILGKADEALEEITLYVQRPLVTDVEENEDEGGEKPKLC